ncbi:MAG: NTP transferase domain-containing protein [Rhodospirillales bacterium]
MECVILAGGLGTRMRPVTERSPKWLLPVAGRPFAVHQLRWLERAGVDRVIVAAGHLADLIEVFVDDWRRGNDLEVVVESDGDDLLGTAGGLRKAALSHATGDGVLVLYGDSYLDLDVTALWQAAGRGRTAMMSVYKNAGNWDKSNAVVEGGRVALYDKAADGEAAAAMTYIDYGLSVLPMGTLRDRVPAAGASDLADLYRELSLSGELGAFVATKRFYEVGSPEGLADLEAHLAAGGKGAAS